MLGACAGSPRSLVAESTYIPDASYYLLMAEISLQRNSYLTAAEQYLNATGQSDDPELAKRATEFALEYGFESFALSAARRWLELEPDNGVAHGHAGRLYLRRSDTDRAYAHLIASLGDAPEGESFASLSADLMAEDNAWGVTAIFKRMDRQYPDSPQLQLALARAAMRSREYELAMLAARNAVDANPAALEPQILIPQALMVRGQEVDALELIEQLNENSPSIAVELEYIRLLAASDRLAEANERLANLVKTYGVQTDFVRMHALMHLAAGELDIAERDFSKLLAAGRNIYECFYYLGRIAVIRGADQEGIEYFARVRGGSYLLQAQISAVLAYQRIGEGRTALARLQSFAESYPRQALAISPTRAQILFELGETDQALAEFDALLDHRPDSVELLIAYGAMLDLAGRLGPALERMRRAVELAPMNANALNTLGYTLANRTRHHDEAYRLIRLALELEPESPAIIDSMGWALYRLGRNEEARSYLEEAYALMDDPEVVAHLGELLWANGEPESARELLDRSLAEHPDHELLIETRARVPK